MKKIVFTLALSVFSFECAMANQLGWATSVPIGDHNSIALAGIPGPEGTTAMVQLIYAGTDMTIDVANQIGSGATGDDEVIAYAWMGQGYPLGNPGLFDLTSLPAVNTKSDGSLYYIRAWEAPTSSSGTGFAPIVPTYYGNSETYEIKNFGDGNPETFNLGTPFNTTIAIPEPTVAAFIGVFGAGMLIARRVFSKQA